LRPYKRNYAIGLGLFALGLVIVLLTPSGTLDTIGKVIAAAGFILAGWSGRQWWYYERQTRVNE
jgi:hypothetical protein